MVFLKISMFFYKNFTFSIKSRFFGEKKTPEGMSRTRHWLGGRGESNPGLGVVRSMGLTTRLWTSYYIQYLIILLLYYDIIILFLKNIHGQ